MKKLSVIILISALCVVFPLVSFAQQAPTKGGISAVMGKQKAPVTGGPPGYGMMMFAASTKIVATPDGGVIVLVGKKLLKYDRNLRLIRTAEIKVGMKEFETMMTK